ncbi:hypothetical protein BWD42_23960 [Sphingobacterium sp. CZ-UAM]|uniref:hypothetical protein n=1 Tax=Sphingobacterium sp. CZ-UAM TaxID=1933868 RepID=UPI0009861A6E|nr:hypothetical protein [Sphingobacterium sp. CZ-UAM]OOG15739.1 hypothetical protein BWD42_23960 [Sphingobacterium sp. CZ-UAM]
MDNLTYENQFYAILEQSGPVGPALRHELKSIIQPQFIKKGKILLAQPYDMHILLVGMVIKRRDYAEGMYIRSEVLDFIGANEAIYHMPTEADSYFQAELDSVAMLIRQPDIVGIIQRHPRFSEQLNAILSHLLLERTFRGRLINMSSKEKKEAFRRHYPLATRYCRIKDICSFLGINPNTYSGL